MVGEPKPASLQDERRNCALAAPERGSGYSAPALGQSRKIGVLLSNLGTPDGTDYWSMRRYLSEFLSDRRVVEVPRLLWFFILHGLILTTRPSRKGKDYETIWNRERDESPLKTFTRSQAEKLQASITRGLLGNSSTEVIVDWGMRYGNPSLESAIDRLMRRGCDRLLLVPLYPQYSAATGATACDKVFEVLTSLRNQPVLRVAAPYYDDPDYIEEIARSITSRLGELAFEPEVILASFHGMPAATASRGDPYFMQCRQTGELIRLRLGLPREKFIVTFQSRFGSAEWLKPYTDETVKALAASGVKRLAVVTPGFSADCLETIDEIGRENAEYFYAAGGEEFTRIACLNDNHGGMRVIEAIVVRELQGWIQPSKGAR
ncbi:MAG TPA: ferrochelatase [Steroidobacteraceae bacterium]|nr:ferrochelatase [Steroidobacteraceae bacterium]